MQRETHRLAPTVLTRLNQEWATRYAARLTDVGGVGLCTGEQLLQRILCTAGRKQDEVVFTLLAAGRAGNQMAERVLVQALLPSAVRLASRTTALHDLDPGDRIGCAISAVWEAVRTCQLRGHGWVLLQLIRAARTILDPARASAARRPGADPSLVLVPDDVLEQLAGAQPDPVPSAEVQLERLLDRAVVTGVIGEGDAAFLLRSVTDPGAVARIATELGTTPAAVRKRRERIRIRLSAALSAPSRMVS